VTSGIAWIQVIVDGSSSAETLGSGSLALFRDLPYELGANRPGGRTRTVGGSGVDR
jgi:hypothetical protein